MRRAMTACAALLFGCVLLPGLSWAQYYPPGVYRAPPPSYEDDPFYDAPGGDYRSPAARPPRSAPRNGQGYYEPGPYGPYAEPPYPAPPPYADADPPRPPAGIYPEERAAPRNYGYQYPPDYPAYPGGPYQGPRPGLGAQQAPQPGYGPGPQPAGPQYGYGGSPGEPRPPAVTGSTRDPQFASLPPDYQPEEGSPAELPGNLRRQVVGYPTKEPAGTVIIDTAHTFLYYVMGNGQALRYGIGVGREGFTWAGEERISRMAEWPDWHPPAEMIERQPYLPRFMAGGPGNPLGARALYLGKTIYRIHGTNQPSTIGQYVSSGCIRLLNEDIADLYGRVNVGTRVIVLAGRPPKAASAQ